MTNTKELEVPAVWTWHKGNITGGVIKRNGEVRFGLVEADSAEGPRIVAALNQEKEV